MATTLFRRAPVSLETTGEACNLSSFSAHDIDSRFSCRAIHMDAAVYPEPDRFNPRRFMDPSYPTSRTPEGVEYGAARGHWAFGFGRRACPGQHIGERSLYIVAARLLWAFDFTKALDADGRVIVPDSLDFSTGKECARFSK